MPRINKPRRGASSEKSPESEVAVLAISSFEEDLASLRWILKHSKYSKWELYERRNCQHGLSVMREHLIPIVIADQDAPVGGWKKILHEIGVYAPVPKLIVTYRFSESPSGIEILQRSAYYALPKPFARSEVFQGLGFAWLQWTRDWKRVKGREIVIASAF